MIRFVDIRNQGTGYRFAFFDTRVDRFLTLGEEQEQCWDEFHEVRQLTGVDAALLARLERLCPAWAHEAGTDDVEGWYVRG